MLDRIQGLLRGDSTQVVCSVLLAATIYVFALLFYRAFLHPLSNVPGPRLSALTYWYEFYYDCWHGGKYMFKIKELHEKYGPISESGSKNIPCYFNWCDQETNLLQPVRITPDEVHINDIEYYDTIYAAATPKHPRWRVPNFMASDQDSMFDTKDPALHRKRRAAEAPSFSKQSIRAIEGALGEVIDIFKQRLAALAGTGKVLEIHGFWNGMTQDVIGRYCFGTDDIQTLRGGQEEAIYLGKFDNYRYQNQWSRQFPWLFNFLKLLPNSVLALYDKSFLPMSQFMGQITRQVERVLATEQPHIGMKNVFHELRDSKHLPDKDRNMEYYAKEAVSFIGGGTETTASALTTLSYHLLANPEILRRLREEVASIMPEDRQYMPSLATLEALPYLVLYPAVNHICVLRAFTNRVPRLGL